MDDGPRARVERSHACIPDDDEVIRADSPSPKISQITPGVGHGDDADIIDQSHRAPLQSSMTDAPGAHNLTATSARHDIEIRAAGESMR